MGNDRLASVTIAGVQRVSSSYDALGRLIGQIERDAYGAGLA